MDHNLKKIGLLTCSRFPDLYGQDQLLLKEFLNKGYDAYPVIWDDPNFNAEEWQCLIFRNTWDYFEKKEAFLEFINRMAEMKVFTLNSLSVIQKNLHKFYLREMEEAGVQIVPTIFVPAGSTDDLVKLIPQSWKKVVVKPAFSAGAFETRTYDFDAFAHMNDDYQQLLKSDDLLLQLFMEEILTQGEVSFVYFDKTFSHSVQKVPKEGDFRVQSLFGGAYHPYTASAEILAKAQSIVDGIPEPVLYARVDGIVINNEFYLMEVELTEPDLYFELGANSLLKFVEAFQSLVKF